MRRKLRLLRKPKTMYHAEIIIEGYGICYASPNSRLLDTETLIRFKFRPRKWIGSIGWDMDRQMLHMYSSRKQRHKRMRFGWEYHAFWDTDKSLHNLRRKR